MASKIGIEPESGTGGALVPLGATAHGRVSRPAAAFLAQLIACRDGLDGHRVAYRTPGETAVAAYNATARRI